MPLGYFNFTDVQDAFVPLRALKRFTIQDYCGQVLPHPRVQAHHQCINSHSLIDLAFLLGKKSDLDRPCLLILDLQKTINVNIEN
jgi:hypothetical protein